MKLLCGDGEFGVIAVGMAPMGIIAIGVMPMGLVSIACGMGAGLFGLSCGVGVGGFGLNCGLGLGLRQPTVGLQLDVLPPEYPADGSLRDRAGYALLVVGRGIALAVACVLLYQVHQHLGALVMSGASD